MDFLRSTFYLVYNVRFSFEPFTTSTYLSIEPERLLLLLCHLQVGLQVLGPSSIFPDGLYCSATPFKDDSRDAHYSPLAIATMGSFESLSEGFQASLLPLSPMYDAPLIANSLREPRGGYPIKGPVLDTMSPPLSPCTSGASSSASSLSPASSPSYTSFMSSPRYRYHRQMQREEKTDKVGRPANAFIIFRSHLVREGKIPASVEHKQQTLSRIAGEAWNLLSDEEKEVYRQMAREAQEEHRRLHPDYKFTPAARGTRRGAKVKSQVNNGNEAADGETKDESERIKNIREKYVKVLGPSIVAPRKRKRKAPSSSGPTPQVPLTIDTQRAVASNPPSTLIPSTFESDLTVFTSLDLPRRPSTSLGFISQTGGHLPFDSFVRPSSANGVSNTSNVIKGLDLMNVDSSNILSSDIPFNAPGFPYTMSAGHPLLNVLPPYISSPEELGPQFYQMSDIMMHAGWRQPQVSQEVPLSPVGVQFNVPQWGPPPPGGSN